MGRPKEHDERTGAALLAAAEEMVVRAGPQAVSLRAVADAAGTTTRAVYSLFGSKEGLLTALAMQAFHVLGVGLESQPESDDPAADLVALGAVMYRGFVIEHPSLYRLAFQRIVPDLQIGDDYYEARLRTWVKLEAKVARLEAAGLLTRRGVRQAAVEFNAMCEGLAAAELRGGTMLQVPDDEKERVWRDAFETLIRGFR